jgi:hypothetical protein
VLGDIKLIIVGYWIADNQIQLIGAAVILTTGKYHFSESCASQLNLLVEATWQSLYMASINLISPSIRRIMINTLCESDKYCNSEIVSFSKTFYPSLDGIVFHP